MHTGSSSHTPVLQPEATGNLTERGIEVGELREGRGGVVGASISPAQSALSGHAVRPAGQAWSSPNLSLSSLISLFLSLLSSCQYLEQRIICSHLLFLSVKAQRFGGQLRISHLQKNRRKRRREPKVADVKYSAELFPVFFCPRSFRVFNFNVKLSCWTR